MQTTGGERYTRDGNLRSTAHGQLVTSDGNPVLGTGGPITFQPTDHDINVAPDGTVTVLEGTGHDRLDPRQTPRWSRSTIRQKLTKDGANLYAPATRRRQPDTKSPVQQGYIEKSNVNSVAEMSRMIEVMRTYTPSRHAPAAERPAQIGDREARRRSGLIKGD